MSAVPGGESVLVGAVCGFTALVRGVKTKTGPDFKLPLLSTGIGMLLRAVWSGQRLIIEFHSGLGVGVLNIVELSPKLLVVGLPLVAVLTFCESNLR